MTTIPPPAQILIDPHSPTVLNATLAAAWSLHFTYFLLASHFCLTAMKNYLVILVTIGMGYAYWYQLPEKVPTASAPAPTPAPVPVPAHRPFVASHTLLDEPARPAGSHDGVPGSVWLGNDHTNNPHR